jgi:hypothetical protein
VLSTGTVPLDVLDRQVVDDLDFAMPRMSTIAGRIVNDLGEPAAGVMVYALRSMYVGGRRRLVPSGETLVRTDESGDYRIMGLAPGTYLVVAQTNEEWTVDMGRLTETMGYAPTYFPGTTNVGDAGKIVLGLGAEAGGTDFSLIPGRAASVSGVALDSRGVPFKVVFVGQEVRGQNFGMFGSAGRGAVAADGGFTIAKIPPGEYKLEAARPADEESGSGPEVAIMPIVVNGSDVENVILSGSSGGTVSGRVTTDTGAAPRLPRLWITIMERQLGQPDPLLFGIFQSPGASQVGEDGTFSVPGVFGSPRFDVSLPEGWMVRAILHDGRDITDRPIELGSGEQLSGVQVIVTDRVTTIGGTLTDDKDAPVADGTVIVFAADRSKWYDGSRFVKAARPDQKGRYRIKGVPPGDYLLAAVEYAEDGAWNDPDFLEPLQRDARKVALAEGDSQTISLKLTPR